MSTEPKVIRWGVAGCGQIAVDKAIPGLLLAKGAKIVAFADPLCHAANWLSNWLPTPA